MAPSDRPPVVPRSPEWPRVAKAHLLANPQCAACGPLWTEATPVEVHHIFPVHVIRPLGRPDLELASVNLVTLCADLTAFPGQNHHLLIGHLDDFEAVNPSTRADVVRYRGMTARQLRASADWRSRVIGRLATFDEMSAAQRQALRLLMDKMMPSASSR